MRREKRFEFARRHYILPANPTEVRRFRCSFRGRGYFEPYEENREERRKEITAAHWAIARLSSKGYMRVIVATYFDRLLERASEVEGITPIVIYTPDAAEGTSPLPHSGCTIVKVNGDYLDTV
jgi:hypothetical protein